MTTLLNEIFTFFRKDYKYVAVYDTIEYSDINTNIYSKVDINDQSFSHIFINHEKQNEYGTILVPYSFWTYFVIKWIR